MAEETEFAMGAKATCVNGPGGKVIKDIINRTGASINIEDSGRVDIASNNSEAVQQANATGAADTIRFAEDLETDVKVYVAPDAESKAAIDAAQERFYRGDIARELVRGVQEIHRRRPGG